MIKRIGMLTSGGDCQALNATMRGVVKGLSNNLDELEVYGFDDGYKGLIYGKYRMLTSKDFSGILTQGGTILGTSRQPFKLMRVPDENGLDKVEAMKQTYYKLCLDCLVILGGNGTQKTANLLREEGLNIIHLPKTIDNDIYGTDMTFGFQSAVNIATNAIDCIHTTASSHGRVFIVEIMGHKVGSLTLHAGVAGGADIILIPEIPYDIKKSYRSDPENVPKQASVSQSLQLQKVRFPKKTQNFLKRNTKRNWKPEQRNIRPFPMRLLTRSTKRSEAKSVLQFRDIHREAENHVRMTAFFPQESVQVQRRRSWMVNMAS